MTSLLIEGYATHDKRQDDQYDDELWLPIPGYEGLYDASNKGRIRSSPGKVTSNALHERRVWKTRVLKPKHTTKIKRQDGRVSLWKDGVQKDHLVARLIAFAWLGVPDRGMTVNHINGDWNDNRPENLEWVTLAENIRHGFDNGLYSSNMKPVFLVAEDGTRYNFASLAQADRFLDRYHGYLRNAISYGKKVISKSGKTYTAELPERR